MKTIQEIIDNYDEWRTFLNARFGVRLCDFLSDEQVSKNYMEYEKI